MAGACFGLAFIAVVIKLLTGWLFPFAAGWRWWVLAAALFVTIFGATELHGELKKEGHGRLRLSPPHFKDVILAVCVTVILLFGVLRL
ncbi:MAG TPA: hypothetical protein VFJ16_20860 [Longimicrobium sp.]|nr:hypothetical protein [Longimicrobium sp.]